MSVPAWPRPDMETRQISNCGTTKLSSTQQQNVTFQISELAPTIDSPALAYNNSTSPSLISRPPRQTHIPTLAMITPSHVCKVCAKTFRASSLLDIHMRVHVGAKPFVCPICGHRTTQKGNLKLHMKKHHGANLPPHIDLVPDSGIWGHPEELIVTSGHGPSIITGSDLSGKRKQVTQAVSSLFDEKIVGLIKRYQKTVGHQVAVGTVTESLEDFIRIASNKSKSSIAAHHLPDSERPMTNESNHKCFGNSLRSSLHHVGLQANKSSRDLSQNAPFDLRFSCEQRAVSRKESPIPKKEKHTIYHKKANNNNLPSYETCYSDNVRLRRYTQYVTGSKCRKLHSCRSFRNEAFAEIPDGDNTKSTISIDRSTISAGNCGSDLTRDERSCTQQKNAFLSSLNLTRIVPNIKEDVRSEEFSRGFDPVLTQMMSSVTFTCKYRPTTDSIDRRIALREQVRMDQPLVEERTKEASCDVINELNISSSNIDADRSSQKCNIGNDNDTELFSRSTFFYRNPAMRNLAEIGKILSHNEDKNVLAYSRNTSEEQLCRNILSGCNGSIQCPHCSKLFKYPSVLEIHLRSHTGERPYKCPYCEYAGTQHNCLKLHIQRHHPDEQENSTSKCSSISSALEQVSKKNSGTSIVSCPTCGRMSPSLGYLKIHMRSHKNLLNHVCHVCGRRFKEYWYLSTHLKTHEREFGLFYTHFRKLEFERSQSALLRKTSETNFTSARLHNMTEGVTLTKKKMHFGDPLISSNSKVPFLSSLNFADTEKQKAATLTIAPSTGSRRRKTARPNRIVSSTYFAEEFDQLPKEEQKNAVEIAEGPQSEDIRTDDQLDDLPLDLRSAKTRLGSLGKTVQNVHVSILPKR